MRREAIMTVDDGKEARVVVPVSAAGSPKVCSQTPSPLLERTLELETETVREQLETVAKNGQRVLSLIEAVASRSKSDDEYAPDLALLTQLASSLRDKNLRVQSSIRERARTLLETARNDPRARDLTEAALSQRPWTCFTGGSVAVGLLSDIHSRIRSLNDDENDSNKDAVWSAPPTFVRETHKYWVENDGLEEVLMTCASELPLLVYGSKSSCLYESDEQIDPTEQIWDRFGTQISSIYFDSPDLALYHERIRRSEGAKLFRVRWYGENQPIGEQPVFLELKTHHESWVRSSSTKERVSVQERHVRVLLNRNLTQWKVEYAERLAIAGNPKLKGEALGAAVDLLLHIRDLVIKKDLRPCVRTCYDRASFQCSKSNALRLTVDRNVRLFDESHAPIGSWCLSKQSTTEAATVPCAVFEVKLAGKPMPESVAQLLDNGTMKDAHKFSKFLTGVSVLQASSAALRILPYWAREPMFVPLFQANSETIRENNETSVTSDASSSTNEMYEDQQIRSRRRMIDPLKDLRGKFKKYLELSEDTPDIESQQGRKVLSFLSVVKRSRKEKSIAPTKRARIEPKSYFAAERTYIQWISAALLLITVASLLNAFSVQSTRATEFTMMFLAAMITVYALIIYFRRLYLLEHAIPYGYQDHAGPVVLTLAIVFGIVTIIYFSIHEHAMLFSQSATITIDPKVNQCVQHKFSGVSTLEFQPSDVVIDEKHDLLLIPSLTDIMAMPRWTPMEEVHKKIRRVALVDQADIEALTFTDSGTLFAVSEGPSSSTLLAFRWTVEDEMELIGRWKLKGTANAEGMALYPATLAKPSRLLVSCDASDPLQSNIVVYDLPTMFTVTEEMTLEPTLRLNSKLMSAGFDTLASTKISAMTVFEGILYVLHDNVRVIRGWELESGAMVDEWMTPRVGREFDKQWEGISLQRLGNGSVVLYMALDTPPQIWSFYLEEDDSTAGSEHATYSLPNCAHAF